MAFDLPRAARSLRFTGAVRAAPPEVEEVELLDPGPDDFDDDPPTQLVALPAPKPRRTTAQGPSLARPRPKPKAPPARAADAYRDEDDAPTTIGPSLAGHPAAFFPSNEGRAAGAPMAPPSSHPARHAHATGHAHGARAARPIPNFRPAPLPTAYPRRAEASRTVPTRRRDLSLPWVAWVALSALAAVLSYRVVPHAVAELTQVPHALDRR